MIGKKLWEMTVSELNNELEKAGISGSYSESLAVIELTMFLVSVGEDPSAFQFHPSHESGTVDVPTKLKEAVPLFDSEVLNNSGLMSVATIDKHRDANEDQSNHSNVPNNKFEPVDMNEGEAGHDEKLHEDIHAILPDVIDVPKEIIWVTHDEGEVGHEESVPEDIQVTLSDAFDVPRDVNFIDLDEGDVGHDENVPQDIIETLPDQFKVPKEVIEDDENPCTSPFAEYVKLEKAFVETPMIDIFLTAFLSSLVFQEVSGTKERKDKEESQSFTSMDVESAFYRQYIWPPDFPLEQSSR